ncbi:type II toxin-antitoxin system VapC family toxin [Pseudochelatococcus sp. B33]
MMFVDASVIVAILWREPGYEEIRKRLEDADGPFFISPLVRFEAVVALARQKAGEVGAVKRIPQFLLQAQAAVDEFVAAIDAEEVALSASIGRRAIEASAAYGKSIGHAASLNLGDCFAYACAKELKVALLYKGNDFAHTDLA